MKLIKKATEELLRHKMCGNDMRHELVLHKMHVHRMNFYIYTIHYAKHYFINRCH